MIGVIGSGSWATAIVKILLEKEDRRVNWWVRRREVQQSLAMTGYNPNHLRQVGLDFRRLMVSTDLAKVVEESEVLVVAVPSIYVEGVLGTLPGKAYGGKLMVSAVKGYVPRMRMGVSQYMASELSVPEENICVVSGPSHAEEVAAGLPTFLEVASTNAQAASEMANALRCSYIHPFATSEVQNLELCGLAKNVYAVAAGMTAGLGYGDNLLAVLTAAAGRELRLMIKEGSEPMFMLEDLIATCFSSHSRNRALGEAVAQGTPAAEHIERSKMVAEGYYSSSIMHSMPHREDRSIAEMVYRVLYEGVPAKQEVDLLMKTCFQ